MKYSVIRAVIRSSQGDAGQSQAKDNAGNPIFIYHIAGAIITTEAVKHWDKDRFQVLDGLLEQTLGIPGLEVEMGVVERLAAGTTREIKEEFLGHSIGSLLLVLGDI